MIENADRYLDAFVDAGATWISLHVEALPHLQRAGRPPARARACSAGRGPQPRHAAGRARGDPARARLRARDVGEPGLRRPEASCPAASTRCGACARRSRTRGLARADRGGRRRGRSPTSRALVEAGAEHPGGRHRRLRPAAIRRRRARRLLEAGALSAARLARTHARALRRDRPDGRSPSTPSTSPGSRWAAPTCCASAGCTYRELEKRRPALPGDRGRARATCGPALLRRRARGPHALVASSAARASPSTTRSTARARSGPLATGAHRARRGRRAGPPAPAARRRCGGGSREGRGHRRRRLHRLPPRREPARATATRWSGVDAFVDYYPRAVKERNLAAARATTARSAWSKGALQDTGPRRASWTARGQVFHLAAQAGVRASWGRDFARLHRPQRARHPAPARGGGRGAGAPRGVRLVVVGLRRRRRRCPCARTRACQPVSPYGVTKLAAEHLGDLYHAQPRPARGEPALLHGLRAAAAAGHGLPPVPEGGPRRRARSASSATASRPATSPSSTTSWPPRGPPADSGRPGLRLQRRGRRARVARTTCSAASSR